MNFQKVLKGIVGIDQNYARIMLNETGIICNWWREVELLPEAEIPSRLTEDNLLRHLTQYDEPDPETSRPTFGEFSPFISTTAGTVERDPRRWRNWKRSAFITALSFATDQFKKRGAIFYAYVNVIGKKSVVMREFAEESRELHIWTSFQPFHPEGEVVAKISIPSPHIERVEGYDGPQVIDAFRRRVPPQPNWIERNTSCYVAPESIANVREVII
jgi:hypothetical protein